MVLDYMKRPVVARPSELIGIPGRHPETMPEHVSVGNSALCPGTERQSPNGGSFSCRGNPEIHAHGLLESLLRRSHIVAKMGCRPLLCWYHKLGDSRQGELL